MSYAPQADQLSGVVQRDEHLRAGLLLTRRHPRLAARPARDHGAPQAHRLTGHARVRVEARTGPLARGKRRVRDQGHFVGPGIVAREPHLLPGHEAARELLNAGEAAGEVDVGCDRLVESLDELQLVGAHGAADDGEAPDGGGGKREPEGQGRTGAQVRVHEAQPPEGEQRGAGVHRALPARGEPRVHPCARAAQRELEVERSVDHDGQHEQHGGEGRQVVGAERLGADRAPEPRVQEAGQRGTGGEVCGVAERGARRQAAQPQVAGQHRERCHERREGPAPVEQGVRHHAKDIGGEAVAGERDAVAARERAHDGER